MEAPTVRRTIPSGDWRRGARLRHFLLSGAAGGRAGHNFRSARGRCELGGSHRPRETGTGPNVTDSEDRRTNYALRRRIDKLIGRVHAAREEIVERGLDAVQHDAEAPAARDDGGPPADARPADARP